MKWNRCRRLPEVSLLAAGALGEEEKLELERHLEECLECRVYFAEIRNLVEPLRTWGKSLSNVEVTPAARLRWERAVKNEGAISTGANQILNEGQGRDAALRRPVGAARRPYQKLIYAFSAVRPSALQAAWRIVWWELIRPSRYAWTAMSALWLAMWVINGNLSGHRAWDAGRVAVSPQDMLRDWEEENRVLAELSHPSLGFVAPAPPPAVLRPRSERERDQQII